MNINVSPFIIIFGNVLAFAFGLFAGRNMYWKDLSNYILYPLAFAGGHLISLLLIYFFYYKGKGG